MNTDCQINYMMAQLIHTVKFHISEHLKHTSVPPTKVYLGMRERIIFEDYCDWFDFNYGHISQINKLHNLSVIPVAMSSYIDVN